MAKGSQLSQLKSALSKAGVTGQQNGKKRKRVPEDKDKKAAKLTEIHQKLNPFDVKVTKLKHNVGGRKLKGIVGRPAQSKQAGLEQRKKTLLKEYEEKGRSGGILDRRFGENDPSMGVEERMLERFTKERQRSSRGAAFNLEDEDELTHYGQSLSNLDDFDNVGLGMDDSDEEERAGQIDSEIVKRDHFGGFDDDEKSEDDNGEPARKKSKAEVMAEVMAKSKHHKLLRQMEREKEDNMRIELDQEFDSLRDLIYAPDPSSTGSNAVPIARTRPEAMPQASSSTIAIPSIGAEDLDYDQRVRELAFDKRAKPKDRTKTEEELALEEKESLEKAERRRRKRMLGEEESDSEGEAQNSRGKQKRKRGGDDLEDDFQEEEPEWLGAGLGDEVKGAAEKEEDNDDDEDEEEEEEEGDESAESGDSDEDEDDAESDSDESVEEGEPEALVRSKKTGNAKTKTRTSSKTELPFVFPCPSTHEEFLAIVDDVEDELVPTVVQRIRTMYHTSLSPDNKFKLQTLATVLIDHILYITSPPQPRFTLLSSLIPHLTALTQAYPIQSAEYFVEKLVLMHKNLKRGLTRGALDPEAKTWPGLSELSLFRVIGVIWPTSDLNHAVISPTRVLMGAYLGLGRVRSLSDIASGLFLCTVFLQFEELSKRLVPEAVNFVVNALLHLAPHSYKSASELPGSFPAPDFRSDLCRSLSIDFKKVRKSAVMQKPDLANILGGDKVGDEQAKVDLLGLTLDLVGRFADIYKGLDGFIELYEPIQDLLAHIDDKKLLQGHRDRISSLRDSIGRLLKFARQARQPLRLQAHKPIPIPTYIPKFESSSSSYLRRQDPDHERNEASKLRNQYKQERKGAIRELRKDSRFLAGVEQAKQKEKDREYNLRMKRVYGSIEGERAEEKAMDREKNREKKRAGK